MQQKNEKGLLPYGSGFFFKKGISNDRKKRKKAEKMGCIFLAAAMSLTACGRPHQREAAHRPRRALRQFLRAAHPQHPQQTFPKARRRAHPSQESTAESESTSEATAASSTSGSDTASADGFATTDDVSDAPDITGITIESKMVLNYAECFNVYYCTDGYKLIDVKDGAQYLLVPDGKEAPDDLDSDVIVIHQPLERIYMAATSPMALFDAIDSPRYDSSLR